METKTNLNTLHCIFFIYQSFAYTPDGKLENSEKKIITNFMLRWSGSQKEKLNQVILETIAWGRENIKTIHDQVGVMFSMIEFLKQQPNFNIAQREYFLMDIRNIARSDNDFSHHNGNSEPQGFGHIGFSVPDVYAASERFERLGVKFIKKPDDGKMKGLSFIEDPDGYWIEILQANMIEKNS